jgi:L-threo-3-deoxy-hexylosonate aldolase
LLVVPTFFPSSVLRSGTFAPRASTKKVLSKCDWVLTKSAIAGTKAAIELEYGYGGFPRRPLQRLSEEERQKIKKGIAEAMAIENTL